jgi:hypothetical protein
MGEGGICRPLLEIEGMVWVSCAKIAISGCNRAGMSAARK